MTAALVLVTATLAVLALCLLAEARAVRREAETVLKLAADKAAEARAAGNLAMKWRG